MKDKSRRYVDFVETKRGNEIMSIVKDVISKGGFKNEAMIALNAYFDDIEENYSMNQATRIVDTIGRKLGIDVKKYDNLPYGEFLTTVGHKAYDLYVENNPKEEPKEYDLSDWKIESAIDTLVKMIDGVNYGVIEEDRKTTFIDGLDKIEELRESDPEIAELFADFVTEEYKDEVTMINKEIFKDSNKQQEPEPKNRVDIDVLDFPKNHLKDKSYEKYVVSRIAEETGFNVYTVLDKPSALNLTDSNDSFSTGFSIEYIEDSKAMAVYLMDDSNFEEESPEIIIKEIKSNKDLERLVDEIIDYVKANDTPDNIPSEEEMEAEKLRKELEKATSSEQSEKDQQSIQQYVASQWNKINKESAERETGLKVGARKDIHPTLTSPTGVTVERSAELLATESKFSESDLRDEIINVLMSGSMKKYKDSNATKSSSQVKKQMKQSKPKQEPKKKATPSNDLLQEYHDLNDMDGFVMGDSQKEKYKLFSKRGTEIIDENGDKVADKETQGKAKKLVEKLRSMGFKADWSLSEKGYVDVTVLKPEEVKKKTKPKKSKPKSTPKPSSGGKYESDELNEMSEDISSLLDDINSYLL